MKMMNKTNALSHDPDNFGANMIRFAFVLAVFLFLLQSEADCQKKSLLKKDMQNDWLIHTGKEYLPYDQSDKPVHTIYFYISPRTFEGDYLQLESKSDVRVFANQKLFLVAAGITKISVDSLPKSQTDQVLVAVNQEEKITKQTLSTRMYSEINNNTVAAENLPSLRKPTYFKDFVVTAALFLFVFLTLMIRLNPRLSSDYFSVNKIFSVRETDDDQFYLRITSANILFYVFTSLMLGLFFLVVMEFTHVGFNSIQLTASTFAGTLVAWIKVSLLILALLFLKIILVFIASFLFDIKEAAGYHFFNFIRLLLVIVTLLTLFLVGYYMLHGTNEVFYTFLFGLLSWVIGVWTIILFFKLSYRVRFSPIHLFSYICATEILPFLIIVKILYE